VEVTEFGGLVPGDRYVLLVEDSPDDVELTLRAFKRHKLANKVVLAYDGAQALDFLFGRGTYAGRDKGHLPALVLLDINMPKLNGHQVLEAMRSDPLTSSVPVVMLTSSDEQRDIARAYSGGANSYVRKPVEFAEFIEAAGQLGVYWLLLNRAPEGTGG
jgi:two-component system response regulator